MRKKNMASICIIQVSHFLFGFAPGFCAGGDINRVKKANQVGVSEQVNQVNKLIEEGAYSKARPLVEKLLLDSPQDVSVHLSAARLYKRMGLWSGATIEYEWVRQAQPSRAEPYIALSEMHLENLSSDLALSMAKEAVILAPNSRIASSQLISALLANNDYKEAEAELGHLLKKFPEDGEVKYLAYKLHKETGDLKMARVYLEEAVKLKPEKVLWLLDLSDLCESLNDMSASRSYLDMYLDQVPDSVEALQKRAWQEERYLFDYPKAALTYSRIIELDPENWVAEAGLERLNVKNSDAAEAMKRSVRKFFSDLGNWFENLTRKK